MKYLSLILLMLVITLNSCVHSDKDSYITTIEKIINSSSDLIEGDSILYDYACDELIPFKNKLADSIAIEIGKLKGKPYKILENEDLNYRSYKRKAFTFRSVKVEYFYLPKKLQFIFLKCKDDWILHDIVDFWDSNYYNNCLKDTINFNRAIRIVDNFIQNPDSIYNYIVSDSTDIEIINKKSEKEYIEYIIKYLKDEFNTNNYEIIELNSSLNYIKKISNYSDILTIVIGNKENNKYCTFDVFIGGEEFFLEGISRKKGHRIKHYESDSDCTP